MHQFDRFEGGCLRCDRDRVPYHDLLHRNRQSLANLSPCQQAKQRAVRDEPYDLLPVVLDEHMADALTVHQKGDQVDQLVFVHGEQLGGHVLLDAEVVALPATAFIEYGERPFVTELAVMLARRCGGG